MAAINCSSRLIVIYFFSLYQSIQFSLKISFLPLPHNYISVIVSKVMKNTIVAVIGGGAWGTALANLLGERAVKVRLGFHTSVAGQIIKQNRVQPFFLPGVR